MLESMLVIVEKARCKLLHTVQLKFLEYLFININK